MTYRLKERHKGENVYQVNTRCSTHRPTEKREPNKNVRLAIEGEAYDKKK